jgi:hypothetical protein
VSAFAGLIAAPRAGGIEAAPPSRIRHLAWTDQGGRPDGVQIMVSRRTLYVGHMFANGFTVLDVADPRCPKPLAFVAARPNTRTHHLQSAGDLLLVVNGADIPTLGRYDPKRGYYDQSFGGALPARADFAAGLGIFDISKPDAPREVAFLDMPGLGLNRLWYTGGRYAYVSAHLDGFTDHSLVVVDMAEPRRPEMVGRFWLPGMWRAGGETPSWTSGRVALHHMIPAGDLGYAAWRDGGFTVLDLKDPTKPRPLSHVRTPAGPGGTHTALPLPGRGLALVLDESSSLGCARGQSRIWLYDVHRPEALAPIGPLPAPDEATWCRAGQNFGPHNLHENRPDAFRSEDIVFATYHNAGLRILDIRDPAAPREIDSWVPPPPARIIDPRPGNALAPQSCDINVQPDGLMYLSDWNGGLNVLEYRG